MPHLSSTTRSPPKEKQRLETVVRQLKKYSLPPPPPRQFSKDERLTRVDLI